MQPEHRGPRILIDDREKRPLVFTVETEVAHLPAADYTIAGCTDLVALERKRVNELATCCGTDRERFLAQVRRLRAFPVRGLVIEGNYTSLAEGRYRSRINPRSVIGTLVALSVDWTIPLWFCGDAVHAAEVVERILLRVHARQDEHRANLPLLAELEPELAHGCNCGDAA